LAEFVRGEPETLRELIMRKATKKERYEELAKL
jgi:hypothetical protein